MADADRNYQLPNRRDRNGNIRVLLDPDLESDRVNKENP